MNCENSHRASLSRPELKLLWMSFVLGYVLSWSPTSFAAQTWLSDTPTIGSGAAKDAVLPTDVERGFVGAPNMPLPSPIIEEGVSSQEFLAIRRSSNGIPSWQVLPAGLMFQSYLAGEKEPRFNSIWMKDQNGKNNWETQLGGRVGVLRYGTDDVILPQGWQLDLEGGAQARVMLDHKDDLEAVDFRIGIFSTHRSGLWAARWGYYHLSSHVGDEFLIANPGFDRLNYVRDSLLMAVSRDLLVRGRPDIKIYGEFAYALNHEYCLPMEFQTGSEYSPLVFNGLRGSPYLAINGHFRQDRNWDAAGLNLVGGWQWRGEKTNHRYRLGLQYYNGPSLQWSFVGVDERLFGWGLWLDY